MQQNLKIGLFFLVLLSILSSCTKLIWEDRSECPCILTLDLRHIPEQVDTLHVWMFGSDDQLLYKDTLERANFVKDYEILIARDQVKCFVWGNIGSGINLKDNSTLDISLLKKKNASFDPLYFFSNTLDTQGEYAHDVVWMNKEHIKLDVTLKGILEAGDSIRLESFSKTAGLYVDRRFISGQGDVITTPFSYGPKNTRFSYLLARQETMQDLKIDLIVNHKGKEVLLESFALGKWLSEQGYNMNADSLSDISIEFDISANFITIKAEDWEITVSSNVEI